MIVYEKLIHLPSDDINPDILDRPNDLRNNADVHTNNDWALRLAALNGHLDVVKYLHENGADINALTAGQRR